MKEEIKQVIAPVAPVAPAVKAERKKHPPVNDRAFDMFVEGAQEKAEALSATIPHTYVFQFRKGVEKYAVVATHSTLAAGILANKLGLVEDITPSAPRKSGSVDLAKIDDETLIKCLKALRAFSPEKAAKALAAMQAA